MKFAIRKIKIKTQLEIKKCNDYLTPILLFSNDQTKNLMNE